ncbi:MAG: hypothetical protein V4607_01985 [Pseudomonadota bacterium]
MNQMMQFDLPMSLLPTKSEARKRADEGMQKAGDHADEEHAFWRQEAARFVSRFAETHVDFLAEDVINASRGIVPAPPDGRAWGCVFKTAAKDSVIEKIGYRPAKTSNLSPKVLWGSRVLDLHADFSELEWKKVMLNYVRAFTANTNQDGFTTSAVFNYAREMGFTHQQTMRQEHLAWMVDLLKGEEFELHGAIGIKTGATGIWRKTACNAECVER